MGYLISCTGYRVRAFSRLFFSSITPHKESNMPKDFSLMDLLPDHETETPESFRPYDAEEFQNWLVQGE